MYNFALAFVLCAAVYIIGEVVSTATKAWIPSVFVTAAIIPRINAFCEIARVWMFPCVDIRKTPATTAIRTRISIILGSFLSRKRHKIIIMTGEVY